MKLTLPLCLASQSPRRKELLSRFGLEFEAFSPTVDERRRPGETPLALVQRLARAKAGQGAEDHPGHLVLAGDTVVVLDEDILGKPTDADDVMRMAAALSGRSHTVLSAYCLWHEERVCAETVETVVTFRNLPAEWIQWYSRLDEPLDKAGGYAIQGVGGAMVERIEGSYNNVVGFPIEHVIWDMMKNGWMTL